MCKPETIQDAVRRLMVQIEPNRMAHITFHASCFSLGHTEGTDCLGSVITKKWDDPLEQEYFDKILELFEEGNRARIARVEVDDEY